MRVLHSETQAQSNALDAALFNTQQYVEDSLSSNGESMNDGS